MHAVHRSREQWVILMSKVGFPGDGDSLSGGGDVGARTRAFDWTTTPLGSPEGWPRNLKEAILSHLSAANVNASGREDEGRRPEASPVEEALRQSERRHRDLFESICATTPTRSSPRS